MIFSYSSIATYKQCPAKFNFAYILKEPAPDMPPSPALERGSKIHDSVESYLLRKNELLHPDIHKDWGQYMFSLREESETLIPEHPWGISWDFKACGYDDPLCMIHGYMDLKVVPKSPTEPVDIYEWKTGKVYAQPHAEQTCRYATAALLEHPETPYIDTMVVYFDQNTHKQIQYHRMMLNDYLHMIRRDIDVILTDRYMVPKPSFKCQWCKYSRKNNGGPCEVG